MDRRKQSEIERFVDSSITRDGRKMSWLRAWDNREWQRDQATKRGHRYSKAAHERT